jgi:hypothetical protein
VASLSPRPTSPASVAISTNNAVCPLAGRNMVASCAVAISGIWSTVVVIPVIFIVLLHTISTPTALSANRRERPLAQQER